MGLGNRKINCRSCFIIWSIAFFSWMWKYTEIVIGNLIGPISVIDLKPENWTNLLWVDNQAYSTLWWEDPILVWVLWTAISLSYSSHTTEWNSAKPFFRKEEISWCYLCIPPRIRHGTNLQMDLKGTWSSLKLGRSLQLVFIQLCICSVSSTLLTTRDQFIWQPWVNMGVPRLICSTDKVRSITCSLYYLGQGKHGNMWKILACKQNNCIPLQKKKSQSLFRNKKVLFWGKSYYQISRKRISGYEHFSSKCGGNATLTYFLE